MAGPADGQAQRDVELAPLVRLETRRVMPVTGSTCASGDVARAA